MEDQENKLQDQDQQMTPQPPQQLAAPVFAPELDRVKKRSLSESIQMGQIVLREDPPAETSRKLVMGEVAITEKTPSAGFLAGEYKLGLQPFMFETKDVTASTRSLMERLGVEIEYRPTQVDPKKKEDFMLGLFQQFEDQGTYDGPLDDNGKRKGVGTCTWKGDRRYEGEWLNNLPHGNGKYTCPDYEYLGQWQYGMKHGRCKYQVYSTYDQAPEPPIYGSFANDKMNGLITQKGVQVLYKDGLAIQVTGKTCCYKFAFIFGNIVWLLFITQTASHYWYTKQVIVPLIVFDAFLYIFYLFQVFRNEARKYLCNPVSIECIFDNIEKGIQSAPIVNMKIKFYHMSRGKNGRLHRVDTSEESQPFNFTGWIDKSESFSTQYLKKLGMARLKVNHVVQFAPSIHDRYQDEKKAFIEFFEGRDDLYEYELEVDNPHLAKWTLVYSTSTQALLLDPYLNIFLEIICLGWIQRFCFEDTNSAYEVRYEILKQLTGV